MKYTFLLLLLAISNLCICQLNAHGSYSIVAICKDGILIGADTRISIPRPNTVHPETDILAYRDTIQKIFTVRKFAMSVTGKPYVGDSLLNLYFSDFEKHFPIEGTVLMGRDSLFKFLYSNYRQYFDRFLSLRIMMAGYESGIPYWCLIENNEWHCDRVNFVATNDSSGFQFKYSANYSCKQMMPIIIDCINSYSKKHRKYYIGGPIMILKIEPENKFTWLTIKPSFKQWNSGKQLVSDYLNGKAKMRFPSSQAKKEFDNLINKEVKK